MSAIEKTSATVFYILCEETAPGKCSKNANFVNYIFVHAILDSVDKHTVISENINKLNGSCTVFKKAMPIHASLV